MLYPLDDVTTCVSVAPKIRSFPKMFLGTFENAAPEILGSQKPGVKIIFGQSTPLNPLCLRSCCLLRMNDDCDANAVPCNYISFQYTHFHRNVLSQFNTEKAFAIDITANYVAEPSV